MIIYYCSKVPDGMGYVSFSGGVSPRGTTVFPIISPAWPVFFLGGWTGTKDFLNWSKMRLAQLPQMGDLVVFTYPFIGVNRPGSLECLGKVDL